MISKNIIRLLNDQIKLEGTASMQYLSMATWAEVNGYKGVASFFYGHSDEERMHMVKLVKFVNERNDRPEIPNIEGFKTDFEDLQELFTGFLANEEQVTSHVNEIVSVCLVEKDYITHNFMQWYVAEQMEEENLARHIIDKLNIIGDDKGGLYLFDRDLESFRNTEKP